MLSFLLFIFFLAGVLVGTLGAAGYYGNMLVTKDERLAAAYKDYLKRRHKHISKK
jgi:hypothetical protein